MSKTRRPIRPIDSGRRQGALVALLVAASLLCGALALAPAPALAMTDENNECANLPDAWQQYQCEQDQAGSGGGSTESGTTESGTTESGTTDDTAPHYKEPPIHTPESLLDSTFDQSEPSRWDRLWGETPLERLSRAYAVCRRTWHQARRATHRNPHRVLAWLLGDPNDSWIQDELSERWEDNHCNQIFDAVGMP